MKSLEEMTNELISVYEKLYANDKDELEYYKDELYFGDTKEEIVMAMARGYIELDKEFLLNYFDELDELDSYDEFIMESLISACSQLFNDEKFMWEVMEKTKKVSEVVAYTPENTIKKVLQNKKLMQEICDNGSENPDVYGPETLIYFLVRLTSCEELCNDKTFMMNLLDNIRLLDYDINDTEITYYLTKVIQENCEKLFKDREFNEKIIELMEQRNSGDLLDLGSYLLTTEELSKNEELAYRYCKSFLTVENIDKNLLKNRDFLIKILDNCENIGNSFILPQEFSEDEEIIEKYLNSEGLYIGINLELLQKFGRIDFEEFKNIEIDDEMINLLLAVSKSIDPKYAIMYNIAKKIKDTGAIVTHFGDDLDNKSAIEAIQKWAEDNDLIKIGYPLEVIRVPAGQVKEGYLNVDTGGHKGSRIEKDGTTIIDGDLKYGVKSASHGLSKLGIYVPEQILELADVKTNKVSALDSRSGLALVRYLTGEQTFKLAEKNLLDKTLTDEQLEEFGLVEAHQKQQEIIDNALEEIEKYTIELPNGEKLVLAPKQILAGSAIAYEKGINYYASVSNHLDENKNVDGVTFAITSKPGVEIPPEVIEYGKELVERYRIDENSSGVFVSQNNEMIVAGGFKNPKFSIKEETIEGMIEKIKSKFTGRDVIVKKEDNQDFSMQNLEENEFIEDIVNFAKQKTELRDKDSKAKKLLQDYEEALVRNKNTIDSK